MGTRADFLNPAFDQRASSKTTAVALPVASFVLVRRRALLCDLGNKKAFPSIIYDVHCCSFGCFHTPQGVRCDVRVPGAHHTDTLRSMEASITLSRRRRPLKSFHN